VHDVQRRGYAHEEADPCAACDRRLCARNTDCGPVVGAQSVWGLFEAAVETAFVGGYAAAAAPLQIERQLQAANPDDGKRHKLDKKITEEELKQKSSERKVEDETSSFEEVKVQKKLMKEGEVVENPMFMTEARRKEQEQERLKEESTSKSTPTVKEEKRKSSFFSSRKRMLPLRSSGLLRWSLNGNGKSWLHQLFLLPCPKALLHPSFFKTK
jgi:hypothetical protein